MNLAMYNEAQQTGWIGFSDHAQEGDWVWSDSVAREYTNWAKGQPDNAGSIEHYAELGVTGHAQWNDLPGSAVRAFFCEVPWGEQPSWRIVRKPKSFSDASRYCKATYGTQLMRVRDVETSNAIYAESKGPVWIGVTKSDGGLVDTTGSPVTFTNWYPGQPDNAAEKCAEIGRFGDGRWNDLTCTVELMFVCENGPGKGGAAAPNPVIKVEIGHERLTQSEARSFCRDNYQSDLVSVHSQAQNDAIMAAVRAAFEAGEIKEDNAWIGYADEASERKFAWTDGSASDFVNWNSGQPDNGGGVKEEDCVVLFGEGKWNDVPCDNPSTPVCAGQVFVAQQAAEEVARSLMLPWAAASLAVVVVLWVGLALSRKRVADAVATEGGVYGTV